MPCRLLTAGLVLAWSGALAATAQVEPPIKAFQPVTDTLHTETKLSSSDPGAAHDLSQTARCNPDKARAALVALRWQQPAGAPGALRVDISKFRKGFAMGRYETTGALAASSRGVTVDAPEPGVHYYWRVLRQSANGWVPSAVARFEVPVCPRDGLNGPLGADDEGQVGS